MAGQGTGGHCSPAIEQVSGNVVTNCFINIYEQKKSLVEKLQQSIADLRALTTTQNFYMLPSMQQYVSNPSDMNWKAVLTDVLMVKKRVAVAVDSAVDYDATLTPSPGTELSKLHDALRNRGGLLSQLPDTPPSAQFIREWAATYRQQVMRLDSELTILQKRLDGS